MFLFESCLNLSIIDWFQIQSIHSSGHSSAKFFWLYNLNCFTPFRSETPRYLIINNCETYIFVTLHGSLELRVYLLCSLLLHQRSTRMLPKEPFHFKRLCRHHNIIGQDSITLWVIICKYTQCVNQHISSKVCLVCKATECRFEIEYI